jgi:hypothetical protein
MPDFNFVLGSSKIVAFEPGPDSALESFSDPKKPVFKVEAPFREARLWDGDLFALGAPIIFSTFLTLGVAKRDDRLSFPLLVRRRMALVENMNSRD